MRRRGVLVLLGSLAAGCVSIASTDTGTRSPANEPTKSPPEAYRVTEFSVATSYDEYVLRTVALYSAERLEQKREESDDPLVLMDVSEIENPDIRQAIEAAMRNEEWGSDSLPAGLADLVERVDFFTGVSESTSPYVGLKLFESPAPIEFDASVTDERVAPESPGTLELSLTNTDDDTITVSSGSVVPFGVLWASRTAGEGTFLLWRNYKQDDPEIQFTDDGIISTLEQELTEMKPGESISRQYEILPSTTTRHPDRTVPPGPDTYRISEKIEYDEDNASIPMEQEFTYDVTFSLEPA